jgi:UDP-N-acetylglucosamine--N-acetylmuramyl-(pentapeptide) pyrophosphoryl-undecaprenol N-acetylglucosamine transferase
VPERGYELLIVDKVPFPRRPNLAALRFPLAWHRAVGQVRRHIRDRRVDVVAGFGGCASAPAYVAARREGVPYVVHEANARPGLANILGARARPAWGGVPRHPAARRRTVGMPLRARSSTSIARRCGTRRRASSASTRRVRASRVRRIAGRAPAERDVRRGMARGRRRRLAAAARRGERDPIVDPGHPDYRIVPYLDRMDLALALADLVVSRSGAATVSEVSALGIPAVYVPYAVGNGEQALNARGAVAAGAAQLIEDAAFSPTACVSRSCRCCATTRRCRRCVPRRRREPPPRVPAASVIAMLDRALAG